MVVGIGFLASAALATAEPLRVALVSAPPATMVDTNEPALAVGIPLTLHLRDRLAEIPEVVLVEAAWTDAILDAACAATRAFDENALFAAHAAAVPIAALVRYEMRDGKLVVLLHTRADIRRRTFDYPGALNVQATVEAAAGWLAEEWKLPPASAKRLTEHRIAPPEVYQACYWARGISAPPGRSPTIPRLQVLRPFVAGHPESVPLAAATLESACSLTNARSRFYSTSIELSRMALPRVLGTAFEASAYPLLRENSDPFSAPLLALVRPLAGDSIDLALAESQADADDLLQDIGAEAAAGLTTGPATLAQRLGALRCLGAAQSPKAVSALKRCAVNPDPVVREAAATALQYYDDMTGQDLLEKLAGDTEPTVAFAASYGLWKRSSAEGAGRTASGRSSGSGGKKAAGKAQKAGGRKTVGKGPSVAVEGEWTLDDSGASATLTAGEASPKGPTGETGAISPSLAARPLGAALPLARRFLDDARRRPQAVELLAGLGVAEDVPRLQALARDTDGMLRERAVRGLLRLGAVGAGDFTALLEDPSARVVQATLAGLPSGVDAAVLTRARQLANDPLASVAQAARLALRRHLPADPRARLETELAIEHPAIRLMLVDEVATNREPWALDLLAQACSNHHAHVRTHALKRLCATAPDRARPRLIQALADPYHWVRLHAAALLAERDGRERSTSNAQRPTSNDGAERLTERVGGERSTFNAQRPPSNGGAESEERPAESYNERTSNAELGTPDAERETKGLPQADPQPAAGTPSPFTTAEIEAVWKALATETDPATRLYLQDVLARAEGKPLPPAPPAARSVKEAGLLTWLCAGGFGADSAASPFQAYYAFSVDQLNASARRAHEAGKIIFARAHPLGHPGDIVVNPAAMDAFWLALQDEVRTNHLELLDGLVFGEETMAIHAPPLWADGWPVFCRAAGLDPERVRGDTNNLTPVEARAWDHWARSQGVHGFNALYDYVKLRYGKLRPGLQVCTFMPGQFGFPPNDREWKFDVGGIYDYKMHNRIAAYTLVRRMKTLWPERPVIWLSLGVGGYEMNPVWYTQETPRAPLLHHWDRAYVDTTAAWLAGADAGWFSTWIFVSPGYKRGTKLEGVQISVEDIAPDAPVFQRALTYTFAKADVGERFRAEGGAAKIEDATLEGAFEDDEPLPAKEEAVALDETRPEDDPIVQKLAQNKAHMRVGFHFYGKFVYDCARVFASLPRLNPRPDILAVRPRLTVWSRSTEFNAPMLNLLYAYDFLMDINQIPGADLPRYRLIVLEALDEEPLADATLAALSGWLKEQPGLLYIHGALSLDPANEAGTAEDHDGVLHNRWPWADEVTPGAATNYVVKGTNAKVLASDAGGPTLVFWKHPGQKGGVLFDAGRRPEGDLRKTLAALAQEPGVGRALEGPVLNELWREGALVGAATVGSPTSHVVVGVDLLTGRSDPIVGPKRGAVIVSTNLVGRYVASLNGVMVRGDLPLGKVEAVDGGLRVTCDGLLQAAARGGAVTVAAEGSASLPAIEREKASEWLLFGKEDGILAPEPGKTRDALTYVRSARPVSFTRSAGDAPEPPDAAPAPAESAAPPPGPRPGEAKNVDLGEGVSLELVWVPPGEFEMGSNQGLATERPVHHVRLTKGFWMGKYEVTQAQWLRLMKSNPSTYHGPNLPVERENWPEAVEFTRLLTERHGAAAGGTFRLPTEAEWEYACRAGTRTEYYTGDIEADLNRAGWYVGNSTGELERAHTGGLLDPNAWGLYDMHGNLAEWCADGMRAYTAEAVTDPRGPPPDIPKPRAERAKIATPGPDEEPDQPAIALDEAAPPMAPGAIPTVMRGGYVMKLKGEDGYGIPAVMRGGCWYNVAERTRAASRWPCFGGYGRGHALRVVLEPR